ncbi:MAG: PAS domain S-box-containing protein [Sulfurimonas sp.]|uniref:PAS domain-containing sensor histidine kinase n=1 Tax=Sulfurimonas sp. TaxID=2022749 RepID=UPI0039E28333
MSLTSLLSNPHKRIEYTHFLVVFILSVNIIFFTQNNMSMLIQVVLIIAVFLHNKDDKLVRKDLENIESKLREDANIFDRNIIVSETDINGIITYANENFCKVSGYSKEELIGSPHSLVRSQDMSNEFFANLWSSIKSGTTFHEIIKNINKKGKTYWVDSSISPINVNGEIIGYKAIRFDITDSYLADKCHKDEMIVKDDLLHEQGKRFEFAINSSRDGFWDYNLVSKEFYLSSGWKERLGFEKNEDITYLDFLSLIPEKDRIDHHNAMEDTIDGFADVVSFVHFRIKYSLITRAGERLLIEDVGDAFFDSDGETLLRITGFHRDITEQERQNKMIESQNRVSAMGDMIGNIAHQWRQPIGAINNTLNDLEFDIELEDLTEIDAKVFLEVSTKVKGYISHLSQTIDDFRDLASNEKEKTDFMVKDVLEEAYAIVETEYTKHNIIYNINIDGECSCNFSGFKRELLQVVINILNNAKDIFLEKNRENPKVKMGIYRDEDKVYISIHDNAGGIPSTIIEKIFDPYFTTKHESIGTGIGLFMSKKMIDEHFHGTLSVENEDDGAKFIIALPRQDKED